MSDPFAPDNVLEMFDLEDEQTRRAEEAYDDELHKELYDCIERALNECVDKGVSRESLKVLGRECGMTKWLLEQSLKEMK